MARPDIDTYATALGLSRHFTQGQLRVLTPQEAFHADKCVKHMAEALRPYGQLDELAKVLVALFDDASLLQIYYDVRSHSSNKISKILLDSFGKILSKRSMTKLRRDLLGASRSPLAECMKRCGLTP